MAGLQKRYCPEQFRYEFTPFFFLDTFFVLNQAHLHKFLVCILSKSLRVRQDENGQGRAEDNALHEPNNAI